MKVAPENQRLPTTEPDAVIETFRSTLEVRCHYPEDNSLESVDEFVTGLAYVGVLDGLR